LVAGRGGDAVDSPDSMLGGEGAEYERGLVGLGEFDDLRDGGAEEPEEDDGEAEGEEGVENEEFFADAHLREEAAGGACEGHAKFGELFGC